jgi:UDP-N-acetylmuramoyl-L-alanyl-D-glutamate--2,6-diaminopimelate ligase
VTNPRTLDSLLADWPDFSLVRGDAAIAVAGITNDSRAVEPGGIFVAIPGFRVDGHQFLQQAAESGASALIVQQDRETAWSDISADVAILSVPDTRIGLSRASAWFYEYPGRELAAVGVTGTDGKTTTEYLATYVLEAGGYRVGRLGTVDAYIGGEKAHATDRMTTPEAPEVQRLLRRMVDAGCQVALVESTSHGLALHRLADVDYDVAAFTNITGDHLDFHETFEAYREAKAMLFAALDRTPLKGVPKTAIVNADDPSANFMLGQSHARAIRFGMETSDAEVLARNVSLRSGGSDFRLITPMGPAEATIHLPALFNVSNALTAAGIGVAFGLPPQVIADGLANCPGVPGRMERIDAGQPFEAVVDYAHTGDAVRKVLSVLREVTQGRIIIVVGAAGERDPGRRFGVGRAAAQEADYAVFTSEDPRSEDPAAIVHEIAEHARNAGRHPGEHFVEVPDRREAIAHALHRAQIGDTVVVCGKGHEQSIIYGETVIPWDDRAVVREELARLGFQAP